MRFRLAPLALALVALTPAARAQNGAPMVPKQVELAALNSNELTAYQIWNLRAALNVAAIQCQYSPYLGTVKNYNALLSQHAREFERSQSALQSYFKRTVGGAREATKQFDSFNTRTWNSFSTLDAQVPFCEAAATVGRQVLSQPVGQLASLAPVAMTTMRTSLTPLGDELAQLDRSYVTVPFIGDPCIDSRGRRIKRC